MSYCLTAEFQSKRIEGEFGTWRQMYGGNCYMSMGNIQPHVQASKVEIICKT